MKRIFMIGLFSFLAFFAIFSFLKIDRHGKVRNVFISPALASTFTDAISAAGSNPTTVHLSSGAYNVDSDFSIPRNITLNFDNGAVISIADGATLAIYGNIDDNTYHIFDDQNTDLTKGVKFRLGTFASLRPEWWGAIADNNQASAAGNSDAIEKAMNAYRLDPSEDPSGYANYTPMIQFSVGKYYLERTIKIRNNTLLQGQGDSHDPNNSSVLILKDGANCNLTDNNSGVFVAGISIINIRFDGGNQSSGYDGLYFNNAHFAYGTIRGNTFVNFQGWAVYIESARAIFLKIIWCKIARTECFWIFGMPGSGITPLILQVITALAC